MAEEHDFILLFIERFAGGDAQLAANQVDAGNHFRDGVLYLDARIDFHKIKSAGFNVHKEFYGTDISIVDAFGCANRQLAYFVAHFRRQGAGRRFFQNLLVAALQGTFALAEMKDVAVVIGHDLHFDMTSLINVVF